MQRWKRSTRATAPRVSIDELESRRLFATYYLGTTLPVALQGNTTLLNYSNGTTPIDKANARVFVPGDVIYLDGQAQFTGTMKFDRLDVGGSSAASAITITSYGTGRATINAGNGDGIYVENAAGYDISNLNLVGTSDDSGINFDKVGGGKNHPAGINFVTNDNPAARRSYVRVRGINVTGFWQAGIYFQTSVKTDWSGYNSSGNGYNDVIIRDSTVNDSGNTGIEFIGGAIDDTTNVLVTNCITHHNAGHGGLTHNTGSGIILSSVKGGTIEKSLAYENGTLGYGGVGIWAWKAANITIQRNESHHNRTSTNIDGGGFDLDGGVTGSVMQYNYSHDNLGSGYGLFQYRGAPAWGNNVVRYNISHNDGRANNAAGISVWNGGGSFQNCDIYGNTIYMDSTGLKPGATPQAVQITSKTSNVRFYNNIIMTRNSIELMDIARGQSGIVFRGNALYGQNGFSIRWNKSTYGSVTQWQNGTGQTGNFADQPSFVSSIFTSAQSFRLSTGSSLRNKGVNLWAVNLIQAPGYPAGPGTDDFFDKGILPTQGSGLPFSVGADQV